VTSNVKFQIEAEDLKGYSWFTRRQARRKAGQSGRFYESLGQLWWAAVLIALAMLPALVLAVSTLDLEPGSYALGVLGGVAGSAYVWWVARQQMLESQSGLPMEYEIAEDGLRAKTQAGEMLVSWSVVRGVERAKDCLFVLLPEGRPLLIPLRAFTTPEEADSFERELLTRSSRE
jgi:hypothetical protein